MNTHELTRETMRKHGISAQDLADQMRSEGLCHGREDEVVERLIYDGKCVVGVAMALFSIVARRTQMHTNPR
jgi:hypothetical protein